MRPPNAYPLIEPLESRIAPAATTVFVAHSFAEITNTTPNSTLSLQFINAAAASHGAFGAVDQAIAKTVGDNPNVYFLQVNAGEDVQIPTPVGYDHLVHVLNGTVVAFFTDSNVNPLSTDPVLGNYFTGLSVSNNVSVSLGAGGVTGDIVANLETKTNNVTGIASVVPDNTVANLDLAGPVTGAFIANGTVSRIEATGCVNQILTGTAANGHVVKFDTDANQSGALTLSIPTPLSGVAGPSISNVVIDSATLIKLGNGGPGAAGGSLNGLTLLDATLFPSGVAANSTTVMAGNGGSGAAGRPYGGPGGSISNVLVVGAPSSSPDTTHNNFPVVFDGGAGGNGLGNYGGGAGGSVQNVFFDYSAPSALDPVNPVNLLATNVTVHGGAGGNGGTGGAGGSLTNVNVFTATPHDTAHPNTAEFQLIGGAGGTALARGVGGAGGSVNGSSVNNHLVPNIDLSTGLPIDTVATSPTNTHALIEAGLGGSSKLGWGGAGGAVNVLTLEGYNFQVVGGTGGNGNYSGGAGGLVTAVNVLGSTGSLPGDDFHAESLVVTGGNGGNGTLVRGGAGGTLSYLTIQNADFGASSLDVIAGKSVPYGLQVAAGNGGNGKTAGGAGGAISILSVSGVDFLTDSHTQGNTGKASITTGNGGNAPATYGVGGAGGGMSNVSLVSNGDLYGLRLASTIITTGKGGNGGVNTGSGAGFGGIGGTMTNVAVRIPEALLPSTTSDSPGLLKDTTANFVTDGITAGETVENTTTGAVTTVTAVTATELTLASDIFAAGDPYLVNGADSGTAMPSQYTIKDATANFVADGVKAGNVVQDLTDGQSATVTAVSANTLTVTNDISHVGDQYTINAIQPALEAVSLTAGGGGSGGLAGYGGAGGAINGSSVNAPGTVTMAGGSGGAAGNNAAAGAGGTLNGDTALSTYGSGLLSAGNAGNAGSPSVTGGRAGVGGSIIGPNVQALLNVSMIAGNGSEGGAGGSITQPGITGAPGSGYTLNLAPPTGNITVQAGSGGLSTTHAGGAGGSIQTLTGFISSGDGVDPFTTRFVAGAGGNGLTAGGAGGSVNGIHIYGGGGADVTCFINAGDAGNAKTGRYGATGGSVTGVAAGIDMGSSGTAALSIDPLTDFHHISAGNGGNATFKGGLGGSVTYIHVNAAIGVRTGAAFGFYTKGGSILDPAGSGGISVGAGGNGGTIPGLAGNVTTVSADAIASIVAGHMFPGQALEAANLATKVDGIILNGLNPPSPVQLFDLSFNGQTTVSLPTNASAIQVALALNDLTSISNAGGVTVQGNATTGFTVTFNKTGVQKNLIAAQEPAVAADGQTTEVTQGVTYTINTPGVEEVQSVQVIPGRPFALGFEGQYTTLLQGTPTAAQIEAALNALPAVQATDGGFGSVSVVANANTTNPGYTVTFNEFGPQTLITPISYPYSSESQPGNAAVKEIQNIEVFPAVGINRFSLTFDDPLTGQAYTTGQLSTRLDGCASRHRLEQPAICQGRGRRHCCPADSRYRRRRFVHLQDILQRHGFPNHDYPEFRDWRQEYRRNRDHQGR